jgi:hypothetical protein
MPFSVELEAEVLHVALDMEYAISSELSSHPPFLLSFLSNQYLLS